jgi:hypothetical protein
MDNVGSRDDAVKR